jgi:hypothetical protein
MSSTGLKAHIWNAQPITASRDMSSTGGQYGALIWTNVTRTPSNSSSSGSVVGLVGLGSTTMLGGSVIKAFRNDVSDLHLTALMYAASSLEKCSLQ